MTKCDIVFAVLALGAGLLTGFAWFRADSAEVAKPSIVVEVEADSPTMIPFKEDRLAPEVPEKLSRIRLALRNGSADLQAHFEEMEELTELDVNSLLLELIVDLNAVELERLYLALDGASLSMNTEVAGIALMERLVRLDADRFFRLADQQEDSWNMMPIVGVLFLAAKDPDEALRRARNYEDMEKIVGLGVAIRSSAEGIKWMRENGGESPEYDEIFSVLLRDPSGALAEVRKIENRVHRNEALLGLCKRWAQEDGRGALSLAEQMEKGIERDQVVAAVFKVWAEFEPEAAISEAKACGLEMDLLGKWAKQDVNAALIWGERNLGDVQKGEFLGKIHSLLSSEEIEARFTDLPEDAKKKALLSGTLLERLAAGNAALAMDYLSMISESEFSEVGIRFGQAMAKVDLAGAMEAAASLPSEEMRRLAAAGVAKEGGRTDPAATLAWLNGLGVTDANSLERTVIQEWAEHDPESAVDAARRRSGEPGMLVSEVVSRWLPHTDAEYVFTWVREEMRTVPAVQMQMAEAWVDRDPEGGIAFLEANNADGSLDAALEVLRAKWRESEPAGE